MPFDTPITLIFNSFMLALATSFLFVILWYDVRRLINQVFALFLISVQVWNVGALFTEVTATIEADPQLQTIAFGIAVSGFVASSITLYALMTTLVGRQPRRFRFWITVYLASAISYALIVSRNSSTFADSIQTRVFITFFFLIFNSLTLYITWQFRRSVVNLALGIGVTLFIAGQGVTYLNPTLGIVSLSTTISSIGALIISLYVVQRELITPLLRRGSQLEAMHEVGLAITSRIATDAVLNEIAHSAASWLNADASGIYLIRDNNLELVAIHELPTTALHNRIPIGEGVAGRVAETKETIFLENYSRDWVGLDDLPHSRETFGSVICVPLVYDRDVIGVLMVIASVRGRIFSQDSVNLLEMLAAQAAVAIAYGDLFNEQRDLTEQLAIAHDQLKTVLASTDSPVLAVDRNLNLIFTNPAAADLFELDTIHNRDHVIQTLPPKALPSNYREALKSIKTRRFYRYEIELNGFIYLCNVARLGTWRIEGFVAVLNDVTELKELDRIKSEMVRMTSHDLKNPLQAAMANLELLRDDIDRHDIQDEEIDLSVDNIDRQLTRMYRIIGGILDLERVRLGSKIEELCDPRDIIAEALDELQIMATERKIDLKIQIQQDSRLFIGDIDQFKRAIINLIENSIKFNREGGHVDIKVINDAENILFSIADNGIGIPSELQDKIFDRFYRGHQAGAEHITGTGLGLSLVKAVVESHGGKLWVESILGTGTTFFVRIPAVTNVVDTIQNH